MNFTAYLDEIYNYRLIYANSDDVHDRIIELENNISLNKDKIKIFSSVSPGQIIPKDNIIDPISWLNSEINKIIVDIEEDIIEKYRLELYLKFLESNSTENE